MVRRSLRTFAEGENNCHGVMGNSAQGVGYGCQLPALVRLWRAEWSRTAGTTEPLAPFGVVTLASGGSEGGSDIGGMRWSQTANFGTLPSDAMPNTFLAHAFDLGDPWGGSTSCSAWGCCYDKPDASTCAAKTASIGGPAACDAACAGLLNTSFYMGPIHPRLKKPVGDRLALAARNLLFGGTGAFAGPTLQGCALSADGASLAIAFNRSLLRGGSVGLKAYPPGRSAMRVLVDSRYWCDATALTPDVPALGKRGQAFCADEGAPAWGRCGGDVQCGGGPIRAAPAPAFKQSSPTAITDSSAPGAWVAVDVVVAAGGITADLSQLPSGATPLAVRYAWGNDDGDTCCTPAGPTAPCVPASCPIWSPESGLPANPFIAKIEGGACRCVAPQRCDG
jgi:sialate O-acetylesterase